MSQPTTTSPPQTFYSHFSGTTRVSQCQKKASSGLYSAREDNKRQTHWQSGWAPLHPDQSAIHLHQSLSHFYVGCPSCHNPPNLSWLGTGTGICWIAYLRDLVNLQRHAKTEAKPYPQLADVFTQHCVTHCRTHLSTCKRPTAPLRPPLHYHSRSPSNLPFLESLQEGMALPRTAFGDIQRFFTDHKTFQTSNQQHWRKLKALMPGWSLNLSWYTNSPDGMNSSPFMLSNAGTH